MLLSRPSTVPVVISFGESNSGGQVSNALATPEELSTNPRLHILNINTGVFEPLQIGVNNNLDHTGMATGVHAWELGLGIEQRHGRAFGRTLYYVQLGHGGSRVSQWNEGGAYWAKAQSRLAAASEWFAAHGLTPRYYVWATLGINDSIQPSPITAGDYKAGMLELFARLRVSLGATTRISATQLPISGGAMVDAYNATLAEIAGADAEIRIAGSLNLPLQDDYHYSYLGHKQLAALMVANSRAA